MELIGTLFVYIMQGMQHEFNVYGHDISLWQIFMFVVVAGIVTYIVGGIFDGD